MLQTQKESRDQRNVTRKWTESYHTVTNKQRKFKSHFNPPRPSTARLISFKWNHPTGFTPLPLVDFGGRTLTLYLNEILVSLWTVVKESMV